MWVFHSLELGDLTNPEDLRRQLLDYCYRVSGETTDERALMVTVSEVERDSRFDSLLEQRVCNRIVDHGYAVIPQYEASGYRIDLVVVGASRKFAVECDGGASTDSTDTNTISRGNATSKGRDGSSSA